MHSLPITIECVLVNQMKVSELIEALTKLPADLPVKTEGCDCEGDAEGAEVVPPHPMGHPTPYVLVTR